MYCLVITIARHLDQMYDHTQSIYATMYRIGFFCLLWGHLLVVFKIKKHSQMAVGLLYMQHESSCQYTPSGKWDRQISSSVPFPTPFQCWTWGWGWRLCPTTHFTPWLLLWTEVRKESRFKVLSLTTISITFHVSNSMDVFQERLSSKLLTVP